MIDLFCSGSEHPHPHQRERDEGCLPEGHCGPEQPYRPHHERPGVATHHPHPHCGPGPPHHVRPGIVTHPHHPDPHCDYKYLRFIITILCFICSLIFSRPPTVCPYISLIDG